MIPSLGEIIDEIPLFVIISLPRVYRGEVPPFSRKAQIVHPLNPPFQTINLQWMKVSFYFWRVHPPIFGRIHRH